MRLPLVVARQAVIAFDKRLRAGLSDDELDALRTLLARLDANVQTRSGRDQERVISSR